MGELGDGAGEFDAGRSASDHDERQKAADLDFVRPVFSKLERREQAIAKAKGVIQRFQNVRARRPFVMSEP